MLDQIYRNTTVDYRRAVYTIVYYRVASIQ